MVRRLAVVAALTLAAASSVQAAVFNLGFGTLGNTANGWHLPGQGEGGGWSSGYNPSGGNDGGPNNGVDYYLTSNRFRTDGSGTYGTDFPSATGSAALGSDTLQDGTVYTISFVGAVARVPNLTDTVDLRIKAYATNGVTDTLLTSVDNLLSPGVTLSSVYNNAWPTYSFDFTTPSGTTGQYLKLVFSSDNGYAGPSDYGYLLVTNIAATVPEPASFGVALLGSILVLGRRHSR